MTGPSVRQQWRDAIRDSDDPAIDIYTIAVAFALDRFMTPDGYTRTGVRRLAALARCNKDTVVDRVARLEDRGLLEVERPPGARGGSSRYRATTPQVSDPVGHSTSSGRGRDEVGSVRPQPQKCPTPAAKVSDPVGPIPGGPGRDPTGSPGRAAGSGAGAPPPGPAGTNTSHSRSERSNGTRRPTAATDRTNGERTPVWSEAEARRLAGDPYDDRACAICSDHVPPGTGLEKQYGTTLKPVHKRCVGWDDDDLEAARAAAYDGDEKW